MKRISGWWLSILVFAVLPALTLFSWELLQRHRMALLTEDVRAAVAEIQAGTRLTTTPEGPLCIAEGTVPNPGGITVTYTDTYATGRSRAWKLDLRGPGPNPRGAEPIHLFLVQRWFETPTLSVIWIMDLHPSLRTRITSILQAHELHYRVHELTKGK